MQCIRCGKEMVNTTGGNYHCKNCDFAVNDLLYRPSNCDMPTPQGFGKQEGWICPVCGRGVAPHVNWCPCQGSELKITYGTNTYGTSTYVNNDIKKYDKYAISDNEDLML